MKVEDVAEKHGHDVKDIGVITRSAHIHGDKPNDMLVSLKVDPKRIIPKAEGHSDEEVFFLAVSFFKHIFKETFQVDRINDDDIGFYVLMQIPDGYLRKEIVLGADQFSGVYYNVQQGLPTEWEQKHKIRELHINVEEEE